MRIRHYLYNAFLIEEGAAKVAIDPGQNLWPFDFRSLIPRSEWDDITHVLITHGDPDHYWQADRVARASGAHVLCGIGLTRTVGAETLLVHPRRPGLRSWIPFEHVQALGVGDTVTLDGVRVDAVRSTHGPIAIRLLGRTLRQEPGPKERVGLGSIGFRVTMGETTVVNLGDSVLEREWEGLAPDVLMLPIGGFGDRTWTMDVPEACEAVRIIGPRAVIPCHHDVPFFWTRGYAPADERLFKNEVEKLGVECHILGDGDSLTV